MLLGCLQKRASTLLLALLVASGLASLLANDAGQGLVENVLESLSSKGRAFEVLECAKLLDHVVGLFVRNGGLAILAEGLERRLVVTKIGLSTNQDDWDIGAMVLDLNIPTILDVDERRMVDDGEAQQEDVGLGVRESTDASITLLSGGIPKREFDFLALYNDGGLVVVEYSGDVLLRELTLGV